jgi:N-acetylmuramoyl-L-alanine amidase
MVGGHMATGRSAGKSGSKKKSSNKMTVKQMRGVIKFLIWTNVILLLAVLVLSILLAKSRTSRVNIIKPERSYTVCIDPGHGGTDTGAIGLNGLYEKDGNLQLSLKVAKLLEDNGVNVVMTRTDDSTVESEERATIANDSNADLFLALHRNYTASSEAHGVEAWIHSSGSERSYAIANSILDQLEAVGISQNRGVRVGTQFDSENNYIVIKQTNMTGLIIEMGFISNETDVELYDENMDDYAAAIANGIISWLNEYVK